MTVQMQITLLQNPYYMKKSDTATPDIDTTHPRKILRLEKSLTNYLGGVVS